MDDDEYAEENFEEAKEEEEVLSDLNRSGSSSSSSSRKSSSSSSSSRSSSRTNSTRSGKSNTSHSSQKPTPTKSTLTATVTPRTAPSSPTKPSTQTKAHSISSPKKTSENKNEDTSPKAPTTPPTPLFRQPENVAEDNNINYHYSIPLPSTPPSDQNDSKPETPNKLSYKLEGTVENENENEDVIEEQKIESEPTDGMAKVQDSIMENNNTEVAPDQIQDALATPSSNPCGDIANIGDENENAVANQKPRRPRAKPKPKVVPPAEPTENIPNEVNIPKKARVTTVGQVRREADATKAAVQKEKAMNDQILANKQAEVSYRERMKTYQQQLVDLDKKLADLNQNGGSKEETLATMSEKMKTLEAIENEEKQEEERKERYKETVIVLSAEEQRLLRGAKAMKNDQQKAVPPEPKPPPRGKTANGETNEVNNAPKNNNIQVNQRKMKEVAKDKNDGDNEDNKIENHSEIKQNKKKVLKDNNSRPQPPQPQPQPPPSQNQEEDVDAQRTPEITKSKLDPPPRRRPPKQKPKIIKQNPITTELTEIKSTENGELPSPQNEVTNEVNEVVEENPKPQPKPKPRPPRQPRISPSRNLDEPPPSKPISNVMEDPKSPPRTAPDISESNVDKRRRLNQELRSIEADLNSYHISADKRLRLLDQKIVVMAELEECVNRLREEQRQERKRLRTKVRRLSTPSSSSDNEIYKPIEAVNNNDAKLFKAINEKLNILKEKKPVRLPPILSRRKTR